MGRSDVSHGTSEKYVDPAWVRRLNVPSCPRLIAACGQRSSLLLIREPCLVSSPVPGRAIERCSCAAIAQVLRALGHLPAAGAEPLGFPILCDSQRHVVRRLVAPGDLACCPLQPLPAVE
eukprot:15486343-Heterocapsa_arctica.AAC.1